MTPLGRTAAVCSLDAVLSVASALSEALDACSSPSAIESAGIMVMASVAANTTDTTLVGIVVLSIILSLFISCRPMLRGAVPLAGRTLYFPIQLRLLRRHHNEQHFQIIQEINVHFKNTPQVLIRAEPEKSAPHLLPPPAERAPRSER